jgi:Mlc titration factor MtfA (ptsG expression regulator)
VVFGRKRLAFSDEWRDLLRRQWSHWRLLDADEQALVEDVALGLMTHMRWEASAGFVLDDEMRLLIAAQAGLLTIGLDDPDPYWRVGPIIVYPHGVVKTGERGGPVDGVASDEPLHILGEAHYRGPMILAWDTAKHEARHPSVGQNVVYHEFAHQLDMRDGIIDGTPPLPDDAAIQHWIDVCTPRFEALLDGTDDGLLDPYGGEDAAEFFAVATEAFFTRPRAMRERDPELYATLDGYYHQDPAAREDRALA